MEKTGPENPAWCDIFSDVKTGSEFLATMPVAPDGWFARQAVANATNTQRQLICAALGHLVRPSTILPLHSACILPLPAHGLSIGRACSNFLASVFHVFPYPVAVSMFKLRSDLDSEKIMLLYISTRKSNAARCNLFVQNKEIHKLRSRNLSCLRRAPQPTQSLPSLLPECWPPCTALHVSTKTVHRKRSHPHTHTHPHTPTQTTHAFVGGSGVINAGCCRPESQRICRGRLTGPHRAHNRPAAFPSYMGVAQT